MSKSHARAMTRRTGVAAGDDHERTPGKRTLTQDMPAPPPAHVAVIALEAAAMALVRLQQAPVGGAKPIAAVVESHLMMAREYLNLSTGDIHDLEDRYVVLRSLARNEYQRVGYVPVANDQRAVQTGIPDVDNPDRCEKPTADGCYLAPVKRAELVKDLQLRMIKADNTFVLELKQAEIQEAMTRHSRWGFVAEMLFNAISATVLGAVVGTYARYQKATLREMTDTAILIGNGIDTPTTSLIAQAVAAVPADTVKTAWQMLSRSARSGIKEQAHYQPKGQSDRVQFLTMMESHVMQVGQRLREQIASTMTDDELVILKEAYDATNHDPVIYRHQVATLLARFEAHDIEGIGSYRTNGVSSGRLDVVRFVCHGVERYAELQSGEFPARDPDPQVMGRENLRKAETKVNCESRFVRWVDDDFVDLLVAAHHDTIETPIVTVDVSDGRSPFVPVIIWAAQTKETRKVQP